MSPNTPNRKPAPYKDKGALKIRAVKLQVTPDEHKALDALATDWECSIAQTIRTMVGLSGVLPLLEPLLDHPVVEEALKKHGINRSLLEWRITTLKRFMKYWNIVPKTE